ncbi:MAG TPA: TlpA disulfide reductase family protein [Blastocatellia bacterium]|nr:TlpA disulfide reductase family protein [Blastocatellia bacterium]
MSRRDKSSRKRASRIFIIAALAVAVVAGACSMMPGGKGGKEIAISPAPVAIDSVPRSLEAFQGKVVILNIWATWCGPCRVEIPDFVKLENKYRDQGLEIVGVSIDPIDGRGGGAAAVGPFMQKYGINYTIWTINNISALGKFPMGNGIPTTYVLDREGRAVRTYVGVRPMSVFENDIKQLL